MNLPNILTLSRLVFAVILVFLLEESTEAGNIGALIVFSVAALTDFYDGYLAKKQGLVSNFGKIMDPIADKVLILSTVGVLADLGLVDWWVFAVIALREVLVTASRLIAMRRGQVLAAERAGKIKTVTQIVAISSILLYLTAQQSAFCSSWFAQAQLLWLNSNKALILVAMVLTVYSGVDYFRHQSKV